MSYVIAIDFDASSGRVMVGTLERSKVSSKEYYRFPNSLVIRDSQSCWDLNTILEEIEKGISKVLASGVEIDLLGIDTYPPRERAAFWEKGYPLNLVVGCQKPLCIV